MLRLLRYQVCTCAWVAAIVSLAASLRAQHGVKDGEWRSYAGDNGSSRYAPYDLITRDKK